MGVQKANAMRCARHGFKYNHWKCMYCCSIATYNCEGNKYFCGPCHDGIGRRKHKPICTGGKNCPLEVPYHPQANGNPSSAYPLGCKQCESEGLGTRFEHKVSMAKVGTNVKNLFKSRNINKVPIKIPQQAA